MNSKYGKIMNITMSSGLGEQVPYFMSCSEDYFKDLKSEPVNLKKRY